MKRENDPSAPSTALFNWYPGHMAKALREIKQRLQVVDLVLEVRDARAPLATGNPALDQSLGQKPKLIVLNKANLADPEAMAQWSRWFEARDEAHFFVNALDKGALKRVLAMARQRVPSVDAKKKLRLMIVGLPNTGKSTLINQLANKGTAKVADRPGQTTIQQWVDAGNGLEFLDTPGVMPPKIGTHEEGLWLSALHAIPDEVASVEDTAIFIVKHMKDMPEFTARYKLPRPDMSIDDIFLQIATLRGCLRQKGQPDLDRVHKIVLAEFRKGELGKTSFGRPPKSSAKNS